MNDQSPSQSIEVRDNRERGWFWINNDVMKYGAIVGPNALACYMALCRYANESGSCFPKVATIAKDAGMSGNAARAALFKLREAGLITITERPGNKEAKIATRSNLYTLNKVTPPLHVVESPPPRGGVPPPHVVESKNTKDNKTQLTDTDSTPSGVTPTDAYAQYESEMSTTPNGKPIEPVPLKASKPKKKVVPAPAPKPPQPNVAIIDAWLEPQAKPAGNPYGRYGKAAKALVADGYTPEQVKAYTVELQRDKFWRGKLIPLEYVATNIASWIKTNTSNPSKVSDIPSELLVGMEPGRCRHPDHPNSATISYAQYRSMILDREYMEKS